MLKPSTKAKPKKCRSQETQKQNDEQSRTEAPNGTELPTLNHESIDYLQRCLKNDVYNAHTHYASTTLNNRHEILCLSPPGADKKSSVKSYFPEDCSRWVRVA